jgi:hypothetical protein
MRFSNPALRLAALASIAVSSLAPLPASAREAAGPDQIPATPSAPRMQAAVGDALGGMLAVLLDTRAEPLLAAARKMGADGAVPHVRPGATLGDLAGPEARRMPAELRRRVPAMMDGMAGLAQVMQDMAPRMEEVARRFETELPRHD